MITIRKPNDAVRKTKPARTLTATHCRRIGSLPGCLAIYSADIGEATLEDGSIVTITWGRNLAPDAQEWHLQHSTYRPIWIGANDGSSELILPVATADKLRSILIA